MSVHKGLACHDCDRVYPFPVKDGKVGRRPKAEEVCPPCDSGLTLTTSEPTLTARDAFELWDAYRLDRLEKAVGHRTPTEEVAGGA